MKKYKSIIKLSVLTLLVSLSLIACGDDVPTDYKAENFVEAVLLVDHPIDNIKVLRTQPISSKFSYYQAFIKDAEVVIIGDNREMLLSFRDDSLNPRYYFGENDYLVKPSTKYRLRIKLKDGSILTGETTTPERSQWLQKPNTYIQYPLDSLNLPPSDTIAWQKVPGFDYYMIAVVALDTLEYGKYLNPPTIERNRRIYKPYLEERFYKELSQSAFLPATRTPVVWSTFKWFGLHEVVIYTPDWNFTRWFLQNLSSSQLNPLLGSIEGGLGVFGTASVLRDTLVLLKNQP